MDRSSKIFALVGAGGLGREIAPIFAESIAQDLQITLVEATKLLCFVESEALEQNASVNGYRVLTDDEFLELKIPNRFFNVAINNSKIREQVFNRFIEQGAIPFQTISSTAIVKQPTSIGVGAAICEFCIIQPNTSIGRGFHCNIYSQVSHECVIGDFVTFGPRVSCNGNVVIEDHAYIGTGAIIRNGTRNKKITIGRGAIVGMGAVVTKDVPPDTTVVGNPAKPIATANKPQR